MTSGEKPSRKPDRTPSRWLYIKAATGRAGRLLVCTAVLPALPIAIFFAFYPKSASPTDLLAHGDFAVLAAALTTAALAEVIGPAEPPKGIRNCLILSGMCLYAFTAWILAVIAGDAQRVSPSRDAWLSVISCVLAAFYAVVAWLVTVEVPERAGTGTPEAEEGDRS
jgi:hypothetical protein